MKTIKRRKRGDGTDDTPKKRKHNQCGGNVDAPGTSDPKTTRYDAVKDAQAKAADAARAGCEWKACTDSGTCFYIEKRLEVESVEEHGGKFVAKVRTWGECQCE